MAVTKSWESSVATRLNFEGKAKSPERNRVAQRNHGLRPLGARIVNRSAAAKAAAKAMLASPPTTEIKCAWFPSPTQESR